MSEKNIWNELPGDSSNEKTVLDNLTNKDLERIVFNNLKDLLEIDEKSNMKLGYRALIYLIDQAMDRPEFDKTILLDLNDMAVMESLSRKLRDKSRKLKRSMYPKKKREYKFDHCALNQESINTVLSIINGKSGRIFNIIQWKQAGIDLVGFFHY